MITWIILSVLVLIIAGGVFAARHRSKLGIVREASGYVYTNDVDSSKKSRLILYTDKLTINDIQILPLDRVTQAWFATQDNSITYRGSRIARETYILYVSYENKDGKFGSFSCETKQNAMLAGEALKDMAFAINKQIGHEILKRIYPNEPYEL